ncbi:hypothetical protein V5O48_002993 [Marasmius crinis-equi]|uniref:Major facilitator superfamily (MFS) profile domain-containing protein n=1 Tax=Marasmius crinis-equi TaxID=585013 RepID=A0ABR3FUE4_9AGAR
MSEKHSKGSSEDVKTEIVSDERAASPSPGYDGESTDPWFSEEKRLVRKLDRRILPMACLLYLFAYLDRTNLGNVKLQGIEEDALGGDPTGQLFDWVNSAFFFTYIIFQIPATIVSKLFPPRIWLACAAMGWGVCSTLMSTGFNFGGLMTTRVFLGIFEAGFGPAIPVYFSLFYTKSEMGLRMAYWFGFAAVAGAFGGIVAFGIGQANVSIAHWRLLFIVERLEGVKSRLLIAVRALIPVLQIYVGGVIYFGLNASLASTSAFLPTIMQTFGFCSSSI